MRKFSYNSNIAGEKKGGRYGAFLKCSNVRRNLQQIDGGSCILACLYLRGLIKYLCKLMGISPFNLMGSGLRLNTFLKL